MRKSLTRRAFLQTTALTAATIALAERGLVGTAWAENAFTVGLEGGSWGEGAKESFVVMPKFEAANNVKVSYAPNTVAVTQTKVIAECGNPSLSVVGSPDIESVRIAEAGCYQDYDLDIVTNYADITPTAKLPPRGGLTDWHAGVVATVFSLVYNTKEVSGKPTNYKEMWNPKYKGRIGIPTFTSNGEPWIHALNNSLGGSFDDLSPALEAVADLAKKQDAIFIENTDHGLQLFTREEIVMAPFWNGRTFQLQGDGVPVDIVYVPGTFQYKWGLHVTKGTQFVELANKLVNNSLNGEYQLEMTRRFRYPPTNGKVKLPAEMANRRIPESAFANFVDLDFLTVIANSAKNLERWNKEVVEQG